MGRLNLCIEPDTTIDAEECIVEVSYDNIDGRMTKRQLMELQEELRSKKFEYERTNKVFISEELKAARHCDAM